MSSSSSNSDSSNEDKITFGPISKRVTKSPHQSEISLQSDDVRTKSVPEIMSALRHSKSSESLIEKSTLEIKSTNFINSEPEPHTSCSQRKLGSVNKGNDIASGSQAIRSELTPFAKDERGQLSVLKTGEVTFRGILKEKKSRLDHFKT